MATKAPPANPAGWIALTAALAARDRDCTLSFAPSPRGLSRFHVHGHRPRPGQGRRMFWTLSSSSRIGCMAACETGPGPADDRRASAFPRPSHGRARPGQAGCIHAREADMHRHSRDVEQATAGPLRVTAVGFDCRAAASAPHRDLGPPPPLPCAPGPSGDFRPVALTRSRPGSRHGDGDGTPGYGRGCLPAESGAADRLVHAGVDGQDVDQADEGKDP